MSLSQRTEDVGRAISKPVRISLDLQSREARQRFKKMFDTIGEHPLVGVGALGGLIALFAYAKALFELHALGVHTAGLLATGDIADFASRFAVPFVLMVSAFVSLALAWTRMLETDQRRKRTFLLSLVPALFGLLLTALGYYWWVTLHPSWIFSPGTIERQICNVWVPIIAAAVGLVMIFYLLRVALMPRKPYPPLTRALALIFACLIGAVAYVWMYWIPDLQLPSILFGLAIVAAIVPVWPLILAGMEKGVEKDQRWQKALLRALGVFSTAFALLVVFALIGTALLFSASVSVLSVQEPLASAPEGMPVRVLESKQSDPILIEGEFVRLSNVWLVKRRNAQKTPAQVASIAPAGAGITQANPSSAWWMVASGEVACVRDPTAEELGTSALKRFCSTATKPPGPQFPDNSIAAYAVRMLGCAPENFNEYASAWVVRFDHDHPRDSAREAALTEKSWLVPAAYLTLPGLQGVRFVPLKGEGSYTDFVTKLQGEPTGWLWVLGFASTVGRAAYNVNLSERRAEKLRNALAQELRKRNLEREVARIKTRGLGEDSYAGMFGVQENESDRIAVAFFCRPAM